MRFDEDTLDTFNDSLERCQTNPCFLTEFYKKFVVSNPEVQKKFERTNMHQQKMMLHASLYMIMLSTRDNEAAGVYMERVAKRHSRAELDIPPELYDLWLETLIKTVSEIDSIYSDKVEQAWRKVMSHGIAFMKSRYDQTV